MRLRATAVVCAAVLLAATLGAQTPASFEVASVKPSQPGARRGPIGVAGERITVTAWTLPEIMTLAFAQGPSLYRFQISGGPDWLDRERFDITATFNEASLPKSPLLLQDMLKALLADRFKLVVREETKEAPIYVLTLASRDGQLGPKLRRSTYPCPEPGAGPPPPPDPERQKNCMASIGYGTLVGRGMPIEQLALSMANFYGIGRLVVDRTGLSGRFDMDMEWAPLTQFRQPGNLEPPPDFAERSVNNLPTLFVALREQLGLALEPGRGPARSIVIERAERPTQD